MADQILEIIVPQSLDEKGEPEEFTWDLYPLLDSGDSAHLNDDGLPKNGTGIKEGMIVVGKSGRGSAFNPDKMPTSLELNGWERLELLEKYGNYWTNTSRYASAQEEGIVQSAYFETRNGHLCAIVKIKCVAK